MKNYYSTLWFIALLLFAFTSCKGTKNVAKAAKAYTPAGNWAYTIQGLPDGDMEGTMMISKAGDVVSGQMVSDMGSIDMEDVALENNVLSSTFSAQGYDVKLNGTFEGEMFKGNIEVAGYEFPITATRKP